MNQKKGIKAKDFLGMNKIENIEQLIAWAGFINKGFLTLENKCELQDIYAHSGYNELAEMFMQCKDRKLVLCSVYNTMGYDEVERLLKHFAKQKGKEIVNREMETQLETLDKREIELLKKEQAFKDCRKSYWKRINKLQTKLTITLRENEGKEMAIQCLFKEIAEYKKRLKKYQEKAEKFDTIKNSLAI